MKKPIKLMAELVLKSYDVIKHTPIIHVIKPPVLISIAAFFIYSLANMLNRIGTKWNWNEQGGVILCYHEIAPSVFEKHVKFISEHLKVTSLDALCDSIKSGEKIMNSVVITFDDGFKSLFTLLPIIKKYSVPVTLYLVSDIIGTNKEFWWITVANLKAMADARRNRDVVINDTRYYQSIPEKQKNEEISEAVEKLEYCPGDRCALSFHEIEEMIRSGLVTVGSHTKNHPCLNMTIDKDADEEIIEPKEYLEAKLGVDIKHFSYPNGDYQENHIEMVRKARYTSAVTIIPGVNTADTSLFKLRRIFVGPESSTQLLAINVFGLWDKLGLNARTIQILRARGVCF